MSLPAALPLDRNPPFPARMRARALAVLRAARGRLATLTPEAWFALLLGLLLLAFVAVLLFEPTAGRGGR